MRRLLLALVLLLAGCASAPAEERAPVILGVGSTPEQQVLAGLTVEALDRAGAPVEVVTDLGTTVELRREATNGRIDLFWDYTGAAWALGLREQAPTSDPLESWERVQRADLRNGLRWLEPSSANATLALFVRAEEVPASGDATMSWLAAELSGAEHSLCADPDFLLRPGGLEALAEEYAIDLARLPRRPTDEDAAVAAVAEDRCFAGLATATHGQARVEGLVPVTDDLRVFPAFVAAPVAVAGSAADDVMVTEALAPVTERLDSATLARLNAEHAAGGDLEELSARLLDEYLGPRRDP